MEKTHPIYVLNYEGAVWDEGINLAIHAERIPNVFRKGYYHTGWYKDAECSAQVEVDPTSDNTYYAGWKPWDDETCAKMDEYEKRIIPVKYKIARPKAYTKESFIPFFSIANRLIFDYEGENILLDEEANKLLKELDEAEKNLVQINEPEKDIWYIWGENMAQADNADQYDYFYKFDYEGFRPFLIPYMVENQKNVKGNIIVIAGGGFSQRWNQSEGYCIAEAFNEMNYNAFVLQRRVTPSTKDDCCLDLQRSIRYLKYHAEEYGIGAIEHIATNGYSGGGGTIVAQLDDFFGMVSPCEVYPHYIPDEIDKIDADYEVALLIYGGFAPEGNKNKNLPSIFTVVGAKDLLILNAVNLFSMKPFMDHLSKPDPGQELEFHIFAGAPHGFGTGKGQGIEKQGENRGFVGADNWMKLADDFMKVRFGWIPRMYEKGKKAD